MKIFIGTQEYPQFVLMSATMAANQLLLIGHDFDISMPVSEIIRNIASNVHHSIEQVGQTKHRTVFLTYIA